MMWRGVLIEHRGLETMLWLLGERRSQPNTPGKRKEERKNMSEMIERLVL
jgi:hypothetical protein